MQETQVWAPGWEDPPEGMWTHFSILAWRIPWIEEPGRHTGSQRVGYGSATNTFTTFHTPVCQTRQTYCSLCAFAAAAKSLQSCPTLRYPIDGSPPGFPVPGILQARTLEWVAIALSNAWKWKVKSESEVAQSCLTLSDPTDCSPPGSSVHEIFQASVLEWGAICAFPSTERLPPQFLGL